MLLPSKPKQAKNFDLVVSGRDENNETHVSRGGIARGNFHASMPIVHFYFFILPVRPVFQQQNNMKEEPKIKCLLN